MGWKLYQASNQKLYNQNKFLQIFLICIYHQCTDSIVQLSGTAYGITVSVHVQTRTHNEAVHY